MSNYNHTRFGHKLNALGSGTLPWGLTLRALFVLLVGMTLAGLALTADMDLLFKLPLTAIPLGLCLAFIAIRPNNLPLEEYLANWLGFARHPQASVFKGHQEDEQFLVPDAQPQAAAIAQPVPLVRPVALVQSASVRRLSLAGVLVGFWLVTLTSVLLIMLIRGQVRL